VKSQVTKCHKAVNQHAAHLELDPGAGVKTQVTKCHKAVFA